MDRVGWHRAQVCQERGGGWCEVRGAKSPSLGRLTTPTTLCGRGQGVVFSALFVRAAGRGGAVSGRTQVPHVTYLGLAPSNRNQITSHAIAVYGYILWNEEI